MSLRSRPKDSPSIADQLEWALKKLGDDDFGFEPDGCEGRWQLTVCEWEEQLYDSATASTLQKGIPSLVDALGPDRVDTKALLASPIGLFLGRYLLNIRKGLAQASDANLEASVLGGSNVAHDMRDVIALAGVAEFAGRFPKMLKRVEQLRVLETVQGVPDEVQDYLTEATKCFVNGQFIGCLLVCRSAIEFALRNRLEKAGRQQALSELDRDYRGGLDGLIELARRGLPWEFGKTLDAAAEVKKAANLAIHRCAPEVETCRSMFDLTRGVLRELFA